MKGDGNGKKVRDLMKPLDQFPRVSLHDDMSRVAELLYAYRKEGKDCKVVIAENNGVPVGLVTMRNIFEALEPEAFHVSQWSVPVFWPGLWAEQIHNLSNIKVSSCFVPTKMISVQAEHSLMRAVYCFNRTKMPVMAVLDGHVMVGVIETPQVLEEIVQAVVDVDLSE